MQRNLAARMGRWSAQHRKKAILGWILFVVLATVAGGAVGQRTLSDADTSNGQSALAERAIEGANFPDDATEQVLVQGKGSMKSSDPLFAAAVADVAQRLRSTRHVTDVESPLAKGNEGQISPDGRSAVVTFKVPGDDEQIADRIDPSLAPPPRHRRPIPTCASSSSAAAAPTRPSRRPSRTTSSAPRPCRCRSRWSSC